MRMITAPRVLTAAVCAALTAAAASLAIADEPAGGNSNLQLRLSMLGRYDSGIRNAGGAEIVQYDSSSQRVFVVNALAASVDVLNLADPAAPTKLGTLTTGGGVANSVATSEGLIAVAVENSVKTSPGRVLFFNAHTLAPLAQFTVGAQPDMLTFTAGGEAVLVANEAEANSGYTIDPEGSVSVIDLRSVTNKLDGGELQLLGVVRTAGFEQFNAEADDLRAAGVRIYGPDLDNDNEGDIATVAEDLEPEYIALSHEGDYAWVSLQEANAVGVLDLSDLGAPYFSDIIPLGLKDHSLPGNELDAGDRDGASNAPRANIASWPVKGMYQPDAIASYSIKGKTYFVLANEGDDRNDFIPGEETGRVGSASAVPLDPVAFPNAATLRTNAALGRLTVTRYGVPRTTAGFTELHVLGGRSFSIRAADGELLYDSGSDLERRTLALLPANFNASNEINAFDDRSDNKGPEPEGVAIGKIRGRTFAFIGLERIGGIMTYDVTNPEAARFVDYVNTRSFLVDPRAPLPSSTDSGPEGVEFISADDSPNGKPLLVVGHEITGTTVVYSIDVTGK